MFKLLLLVISSVKDHKLLQMEAIMTLLPKLIKKGFLSRNQIFFSQKIKQMEGAFKETKMMN